MERVKLATNTKIENTDQNGEAAEIAASSFGPYQPEQDLSEEARRQVRRVTSWYRSLNGPDKPKVSMQDVLCKHSEVYGANSIGMLDYDFEDVVNDRFSGDIDISNQRPNKALYLQACLLHEAAYMSEDIDDEEWLLRQAGKAYERVTKSDSELGKFQLQEARRHIYDIEFRLLTNSFRDSFYSERFDEEEFIGLITRYEKLQRGYIKELLYWSGTDVEGREKSHVGILFEWLTVLAYRHKVWRDCAFADTEVRLALPREDQPYIQRKKGNKNPLSRAVDAVIYYHPPNGESEVEYIQCKISRNNKEYLPIITMTKAVNSPSLREIIHTMKGKEKEKALQRSFIKAAKAIGREYDDSATYSEEVTITELQSIISNHAQAA